MLAIIGGNGMAQLPGLEISHRQIIRTPYGEPSGPFTFGKIRNRDVAFLGRHGHNFTIPPHAINYRANICALHSLQPSHVVAITSVRGIRSDLAPGRLVIPNQIIDYTHSRKFTFFEDTEQRFKQADFTVPYSQQTRALLLQGARDANLEMLDGGVYAATQRTKGFNEALAGSKFEVVASVPGDWDLLVVRPGVIRISMRLSVVKFMR